MLSAIGSIVGGLGMGYAALRGGRSGGDNNGWLQAYNYMLNQQSSESEFQRQRRLIKEQNEYNSPKNQMQRYIDAGLNPNLLYGQISSGNQSSVASYSPVQADFKSDFKKKKGTADLMQSLSSQLLNFQVEKAKAELEREKLNLASDRFDFNQKINWSRFGLSKDRFNYFKSSSNWERDRILQADKEFNYYQGLKNLYDKQSPSTRFAKNLKNELSNSVERLNYLKNVTPSFSSGLNFGASAWGLGGLHFGSYNSGRGYGSNNF